MQMTSTGHQSTLYDPFQLKERVEKIQESITATQELLKQNYRSEEALKIIGKFNNPKLEKCGSIQELNNFLFNDNLPPGPRAFRTKFNRLINQLKDLDIIPPDLLDRISKLKNEIFTFNHPAKL